MSSNEAKIRQRYSKSIREEERSTISKANTLEFYYTLKLLRHYINQDTSVLEIGCGTGFYGVQFANECKEYVGIDLSPECIEMFQAKIEEKQLKNVKAFTGDATKLDAVESSRFDVVMVLGPMYHLPHNERDIVFSECKRICKENGIIIVAYICKIGVYVKGCLEFPDKYPSKEINKSVLYKGIDDVKPDIFFYTMPEEIEKQAKSHGLSVVQNVGVNFVFNEKIVSNMNSEQFAAWMEITDFMFQSPSCTGLSNHTVLVCKK